MAVRGTLLPVIGGLTALGNTFADDHELGQVVTRKGFRVQLSRYVVTTTVPETRLGNCGRTNWLGAHGVRTGAGRLRILFFIYAPPMALIYFAVSRNLDVGLTLLGFLGSFPCGISSSRIASLFGRRRTFR